MNIKRPLIWLLASYLAGLASFPLAPVFTVIIALISLILIFLWLFFPRKKRKEKLRNYFFLLCLPLLLLSGYILMNRQLEKDGMDLLFEDEIKGKVTGKVTSFQEKKEYQVLTLKNVTYRLNGDRIYSGNKVTVYTTSKVRYKIGYVLTVSGKIKKFQHASNQGQFNEYLYNKMQKIDYKVFGESIEVIDIHISTFQQFLHDLRNHLKTVYEKLLPPKNAGILSAMVLGDNSLLEEEMKELYRKSGISHILAISGLHISILGLTLYKLLRRLRCPSLLNSVVSIFIIISYGILTNFSVSTNRAVVMMIILIGADLIGRTYDLLSATALSALIILIQSPLQITNGGFLLSFGAILGIALLNPLISELIPLKGKLWNGFRSSLSIQVITLPAILYFFYEVPTYAVLINMIILPSSTIILLLAILAGIGGCIWLPLGKFLIGGTNDLLNFYEWVCRMGAKLPGKSILIGRPAPWVIAAYISLLILILICHKRKKKKLCIAFLPFLLIIFIKPQNITFNITFLDVGQGDGIFMESPTGTTYLIDGGSSDVSKVGKYRIEQYLKSKGIAAIDYAIVTHMDTDHISGLKEIMENMADVENKNNLESAGRNKRDAYQGYIQIRNLVLPDILQKKEAYSQLVNLALLKGIQIRYMKKGDFIKDGDMRLTCLNPAPAFFYSSLNASSIVLSVNYGKFDMLLTGDMQEEGEETVIKVLREYMAGSDVFSNKKINQGIPAGADYDVLKVAHHGSKNSTSVELLSIIKPELSIISCGRNNSYGHPHKELLDRLDEVGSEKLITYNTGAITFMTDGVILKYKKFLEN